MLEEVAMTITDLDYCLENIRTNVGRNSAAIDAAGGAIRVAASWFDPDPLFMEKSQFDMIIAADVVWLEHV